MRRIVMGSVSYGYVKTAPSRHGVAAVKLRHRAVALAGFMAFAGCGSEKQPAPHITEVRPLASPAGERCALPNLSTIGKRVFVSWMESEADGPHTLRFATLDGDAWSPPRAIARGTNWFVNWADFPSLVAWDDGTLAAHWLRKSGEGTYAYDVAVSWSMDGGGTWSAPMRPHTDGTQTEHGFVSMLPWSGGKLFLTWLDGRNTGGGHDSHDAAGAMTLRCAMLTADGTLSGETELDPRVCDCCQTSVVRAAEGLIVAYRDRSEDEVRDISIVRYVNDTWGPPATPNPDGWKIPGCPVNGPALGALREQVAMAWFTAADDRSRVYIAWSNDEGANFGAPIRVDDGDPLGRVDIAMFDDGAAIVVWLEQVGEAAEVRGRYVAPGAPPEDSFVVATSSGARASGFPQIAISNDRAIFAWTDASEPSTVRTAIATR